MTSGLDRLCEAVEAAEAAESARRQEGFMCPNPGCARIFSKRYNQQAHMRLHDGTRPFSCPRCNKDFMWKSSLKSHAKMHNKMDAAAAALAAKRAAHPASANAPTSSIRSPHKQHPTQVKPIQAKPTPKQHTKRVAKRQSKTPGSSQTRKVARHSTKAPANAALKRRADNASRGAVGPSVSVHRSLGGPSRSHHVSSPQARPSTKPKGPMGRQSPDSVTRMDLETATLLTMFQ
ncbi:unnamed protein product [Chondrus crispus]|uniref:C2H2-type domain-containing protein n=1 Tax=Chondrus crispus TaxID=2769 RepID=R7Q421_CHOCR|nr:unnamed protein product [Chondrus crispus]CDF33277.1 unnamed protein product [Chondrus crispus]|eukprot:XP_005713080.1 unnamed protein product [Chondrus crispus]